MTKSAESILSAALDDWKSRALQAEAKLKSLKSALSHNGITLHDGKFYLTLYAGDAPQHCHECPFNSWDGGSISSCTLNRPCYLSYSRPFSVKEIQDFFIHKNKLSDTSARKDKTITTLKHSLQSIINTANSALYTTKDTSEP